MLLRMELMNVDDARTEEGDGARADASGAGDGERNEKVDRGIDVDAAADC